MCRMQEIAVDVVGQDLAGGKKKAELLDELPR